MPARRRIRSTAATGLTARYRARELVEVELTSYLRGLCDALGIDPATVTGFDDASGELLLGEPETG